MKKQHLLLLFKKLLLNHFQDDNKSKTAVAAAAIENQARLIRYDVVHTCQLKGITITNLINHKLQQHCCIELSVTI